MHARSRAGGTKAMNKENGSFISAGLERVLVLEVARVTEAAAIAAAQ